MDNLNVEYSDKKVTPFGGMVLMQRFVESTKIKEQLQLLDLPISGSNRGYDAAEIIERFWLSI